MGKKITLLVLCTFIFMGGNGILRSAVKTYTLDEAITAALANNKQTKISLLDVEKASAAVDEAFGHALPTVNLEGQFYHFLQTPEMPFPDFAAMLTNATYDILFKEKVIPRDNKKYLPMNYTLQSFSLPNNYEAKITATQILFNSAVLEGIGASKIYYDASLELLRSNVNSTALSVKKAYYGVLVTKEMLKIIRESYRNAKDNLDRLNALHKQGMVADFDVLQAQVRVENIKPTILQMENTLKNAKNGLKLVMGIAQTDSIDIDGELSYTDESIPEEDNVINTAMKDNYDIKSLEYKQKVDEAFIKIDESDYWPTVAAFGNYSFNGVSNNFDFMNYRSSIIGVSLSINLYNGSQTEKKVQQATITSIQTKEQLHQLKDAVKVQVKSKILELKRVKEIIQAQERNVSLAQRAYELSRIRFDEGTGTQLEIKNAELELQTAKTNRLQSVYDYIIAKSELESLTGNISAKYLNAVENRIKK